MWGGGTRRGRGGGSGGDHGGVSVWVYSAYRRWGPCYRHIAHERRYSIRRDRRGVSGGSHRTRGLRCRRGARKRGYSIRRDRRGASGGSHRTRGLCCRRGARKRGYSIQRPLWGEWWEPPNPWAVLWARNIGSCAQGGGQRRLLPRP